MSINPNLTSNARYLFDQIEPELYDRPLHEILAKRARSLRDLLKHWWTALEPEVTAGVSVGMMEKALVGISEKALGSSGQSVSRRWARGSLNRKATTLQTDAEQAIAERFLVACERNGILIARGQRVAFTHPSLLELYLGLGLLATRVLPVEVRQMSRVSLAPLQLPRGRAVLAFLAVVEPEELEKSLVAVAAQNLHLATWFLYFNKEACQKHGEWLAAEILGTLQWDLDEPSKQALERSLDSLGTQSLHAARRFIDERQGSLPGHLSAISFLAHYGDPTDLPRLQSLLDETMPGQWEIERLRKTLRESEALILDEEAQKRYAHEENVEMAKQTAAAILSIAGTILTSTSKPATQWTPDMQLWTSGQGAGAAGKTLAGWGPSNFFQQQAALRELLAQLPPVIERRKVQIAEATPRFRHACEVAMQVLSQPAGNASQ